MNTVALIPSSRAAQATAWPWLPALAAITPARRCSSSSVESLLTAPRTLNAPVRWRFSALNHTGLPTRRVNDSLPCTGVENACPPTRTRAASMSASVGRSKVKHLLEDLTNRSQRIELAPFDVVEQAAQLRIVLYRQLEVAACPRGRDLEHLLREIRAAPTLELALGLEPRAVLGDLLPERVDTLAAHRLGQHDRRFPAGCRPEREHLPNLGQHRLRHRVVHLVDRD